MELSSDRKKFRFRASQAADYLGVSLMTLTKIEQGGELVPFRTPGGHRRYSLELLEAYVRNKRRSRGRRNVDASKLRESTRSRPKR